MTSDRTTGSCLIVGGWTWLSESPLAAKLHRALSLVVTWRDDDTPDPIQ
jgi:hypothetical protein